MTPGSQTPQGNRLLTWLARFLAVYALWLILSGVFYMEFLVMGALASAAVVIVTAPLGTPSTHERSYGIPFGHRWLAGSFLRFLLYAPWLLAQIAVANIQVVYLILHPRMPISPRLMRLRTGLDMELPQLLLAQSITLTPGTITVDFHSGEMLIHSLGGSVDQILEEGGMRDRTARVFGEIPDREAGGASPVDDFTEYLP